jgi:hypothetical protein
MAASVEMAVLGLVAAVTSKILADEFKAWRPRLTKSLITLAVRKLPEEQHARYGEEWSSYVEEIPGEVGKLLGALSLLRAGTKLRSMILRESKLTALADSQIGTSEELIGPFDEAKSEDLWRRIEGPKGLRTLLRNARLMLEIAYSAAESDVVDRLFLESFRRDSIQIQVFALSGIIQNQFGRTGEGARINAFRAAQMYDGFAPKFAQLLQRMRETSNSL